MKRRVSALALACGLTLAGCGSGDDGAADARPTASPTITKTADPQAAEKRRVLATYQGMTDAETRTYAKAKLDPELERYAGDKALANIKATLFQQQQDDTVMEGKVKRDPNVINDITDEEAQITDCADSTQYKEVKKKTGEKIPYSGEQRHVVTATAQRSSAEDKWKIYSYEISRTQTC